MILFDSYNSNLQCKQIPSKTDYLFIYLFIYLISMFLLTLNGWSHKMNDPDKKLIYLINKLFVCYLFSLWIWVIRIKQNHYLINQFTLKDYPYLTDQPLDPLLLVFIKCNYMYFIFDDWLMTLSTACQLLSLVQPQFHEPLKEHNHVFAHAKI